MRARQAVIGVWLGLKKEGPSAVNTHAWSTKKHFIWLIEFKKKRRD
jgi:hypothetical protein